MVPRTNWGKIGTIIYAIVGRILISLNGMFNLLDCKTFVVTRINPITSLLNEGSILGELPTRLKIYKRQCH